MTDRENIPVELERAWKDEEYRKSLTPEQIAQLPPNPAGEVELNNDELDQITGGTGTCWPAYRINPQKTLS